MVAYNITAELRSFYRAYGLLIGGGTVTKEMQKKFAKKEVHQVVPELRQMEKYINGNFESLDKTHYANYVRMSKVMPEFGESLTKKLIQIGKLQLLRRIIVKQISLSASVECGQYNSCLHTFNEAIINNLDEIKEDAFMAAEERAKVNDEMD